VWSLSSGQNRRVGYVYRVRISGVLLTAWRVAHSSPTTSPYGAVKCRLIAHFRGQALLLRVLHVVTCDNVRDCVFLKDDLNREKKGLNSYELNFSLPTNSQNKLTELN